MVVSCISGIAIVLIAGVIGWTVTSLRIASTRHALRTPCMLRLKKRSVRSISVGAGLPAMVSSVIGCAPDEKKPLAKSCIAMRRLAAGSATCAGASPLPTSVTKLNSRMNSMRSLSHGPYSMLPMRWRYSVLRVRASYLTVMLLGVRNCSPTVRLPPLAGCSLSAYAPPATIRLASISLSSLLSVCGNGQLTSFSPLCTMNGTHASALARSITARYICGTLP